MEPLTMSQFATKADLFEARAERAEGFLQEIADALRVDCNIDAILEKINQLMP